jgi:ATP-dependent protease HslVU (ClpYQ) peptidase subunit
MTVVAALAYADRVVMAADRLTNYGGTGVYMCDNKIRRIVSWNGEHILIAASGHGAMLAVIGRNLKIESMPEDSDQDDVQDWADAIANAITELMAQQTPPILHSNDGDETTLNGALLLGWRGHLFYVFTHHAVRVHDGIAALGSGADVALGALHASTALEAEALEAVDLAVRLACRLMDGCGIDERGPYVDVLVNGQAEPPERTYTPRLNRV